MVCKKVLISAMVRDPSPNNYFFIRLISIIFVLSVKYGWNPCDVVMGLYMLEDGRNECCVASERITDANHISNKPCSLPGARSSSSQKIWNERREFTHTRVSRVHLSEKLSRFAWLSLDITQSGHRSNGWGSVTREHCHTWDRCIMPVLYHIVPCHLLGISFTSHSGTTICAEKSEQDVCLVMEIITQHHRWSGYY
jgi:hypothetical protein